MPPICSNPLRIDFCNSSFAAIIIIIIIIIIMSLLYLYSVISLTAHNALQKSLCKIYLRNLFTMNNLETKTNYISLAN